MSRWGVLRRALSNRDLRRALAAYQVFCIAEWANFIVLLVWAFDRSGVAGASAIALIQLVPSALLAPLGAMLSNRYSRARALICGYAAQAAGFLLTGIVLAIDAPFVFVSACAASAGVAVTLTRPVHYALLPEISDSTADLTASNTASGAVEALAYFLGPLFCGVAIVPFGPEGVLLILAAVSAISVAVTLTLPSHPPARMIVGGSVRSSGMRTVLASPAARLLTLFVVAEYVLVGMMDILLVVLALDVLDLADSGPGLLTSAVGVGAICGALLGLLMVGRSRLAPLVAVGACAAGLPIAVAGQVEVVLLAVVLLAVTGLGRMFFHIATRTLTHRALPEDQLTAAFGVQEGMMMAATAAGTLLAPLLLHVAGSGGAFFVAGTFVPLVTLLALRRLRRLDAEAVVPETVLRLLNGVPFLSVLRARVLERLARDAEPAAAATGTSVIREGEPGSRFYVIESGSVAVEQSGHLVRELGPGDWFGELALLRDVPRSATVTARDELTMVALRREPFLLAVTGMPQATATADQHARGYRDPVPAMDLS